MYLSVPLLYVSLCMRLQFSQYLSVRTSTNSSTFFAMQCHINIHNGRNISLYLCSLFLSLSPSQLFFSQPPLYAHSSIFQLKKTSHFPSLFLSVALRGKAGLLLCKMCVFFVVNYRQSWIPSSGMRLGPHGTKCPNPVK